MLAGADYVEINHEQDVVTITVREGGRTATAYLKIYDATQVRGHLNSHLNAAASWFPPLLTEYTSKGDL